ncbi:MAG: hypothetical protein ACRD0Y_10570 [Terriglobales bacterium]
MTSMDIRFRYEGALDEVQIRALAKLSDVYGIRALRIDEAGSELALEYDATRMDAARVEALVRGCGVAPLPEAVSA